MIDKKAYAQKFVAASLLLVMTMPVAFSQQTVTSISPTSGPNTGGTTVSITGTGFTSNGGLTRCTFGGIDGTAVTVISATSATCVSPDTGGSAGFFQFVVLTATTSAVSPTPFNYIIIPAPTVTAVSPSSTDGGGVPITITGTNFTGATAVTVGGAACTGFTVVSATTITCTAPALNGGSKSVLVTTAGGTNAANTLLLYTNPVPTLSEWALILFGLLMAGAIGWYQRPALRNAR